jgi:hypothetical protein
MPVFHSPRSRKLTLGQRAALQYPFHNTSTQHRKRALGHGLAHCRCNHRPNCILRFWILAGSILGMLQQSGNQGAFRSAQYPFVPH